MNWSTRSVAIVSLGFLLCGMYAGYSLAHREVAPPVIETAAKEVRQADGSLVVERAPTVPPEEAPVKVAIPKGAVVERVVVLRVQPEREPEPDLSDEALIADYNSLPPCPEVRVDLALVKLPDDTRRVIATASNGRIVGGLDVPVAPISPPPRALLNAAGLAFRVPSGFLGAFYDRDVGPFRAGVEVATPVTNGRALTAIEAGVRFGVRF